MSRYSVGRFHVAVPEGMRPTSARYEVRFCEIEEFPLPAGKGRAEARAAAWEKRLAAIRSMKPPRGVSQALIETKTAGTNPAMQFVFYHGDPLTNQRAMWDVLLDAGPVGVWLRIEGRRTLRDDMLAHVTGVGRAYMAADGGAAPAARQPRFHLLRGAIGLPFEEQEEARVLFKDPGRSLDLSVAMETIEEPQPAGILDRLGAVIASGYAQGAQFERLRSGRRRSASLDGEEVVVRITSGDARRLAFAWEYPGKANSGDHPEIVITMDAPDGGLEEKTIVWDAILDSLAPAK